MRLKLSTTERLYNLTDGIYAIVITLLVLDLKAPHVPGLTEEQLFNDLAKQTTSFMSYVISFYIAARFWVSHHGILRILQVCDQRIIALNFIHILFVSLIPYTASLAGRYDNDQVAVILFLGDLALSSISLDVLLRYVHGRHDWHKQGVQVEDLEPWPSRHALTAIALLSIVVSFFDNASALYTCIGGLVIAAVAGPILFDRAVAEVAARESERR